MESQERDVSPSERLAELLKMRPSKARSPDKALSICGELVDLGSELGEVAGLRASLEWARDLESWEIPDVTRARLYYFQGNACLAIDELNHRNQTSVWNWDREEIEYAIIALRRACRAVGFQALPGYQRSAFLTNLANTMDTVGRFVASSMTYVQAMDSDPTFGMPMANRSISLWHYAQHHYDPGHQRLLLWHANSQMTDAMKLPLEAGTEETFAAHLQRFRQIAGSDFLDNPLELKVFSLGDTEEEVKYRRWCLTNRLFLNALNDCFYEPVAAADVLHLPSIVRPIGEGPGFHGFFNQLKQEYVSARFMLYESFEYDDVHFSTVMSSS